MYLNLVNARFQRKLAALKDCSKYRDDLIIQQLPLLSTLLLSMLILSYESHGF